MKDGKALISLRVVEHVKGFLQVIKENLGKA